MYGIILIIIIVLIILSSMIRILREYERAVIFRLGRLVGVKGPGLIILIPFIDRMIKVSLRVLTYDVPPQDVITRDNISVNVNAVAYFRPFDPAKAIVAVENYIYATSQICQTTLRSVLGEYELDDLLTKREAINQRLQKIIDQQTDPHGKGAQAPDHHTEQIDGKRAVDLTLATRRQGDYQQAQIEHVCGQRYSHRSRRHLSLPKTAEAILSHSLPAVGARSPARD